MDVSTEPRYHLCNYRGGVPRHAGARLVVVGDHWGLKLSALGLSGVCRGCGFTPDASGRLFESRVSLSDRGIRTRKRGCKTPMPEPLDRRESRGAHMVSAVFCRNIQRQRSRVETQAYNTVQTDDTYGLGPCSRLRLPVHSGARDGGRMPLTHIGSRLPEQSSRGAGHLQAPHHHHFPWGKWGPSRSQKTNGNTGFLCLHKAYTMANSPQSH